MDESRTYYTDEVSQKEKDKYCILMHIYRIEKNGTEEFMYKAAMRGEESEMYEREDR